MSELRHKCADIIGNLEAGRQGSVNQGGTHAEMEQIKLAQGSFEAVELGPARSSDGVQLPCSRRGGPVYGTRCWILSCK